MSGLIRGGMALVSLTVLAGCHKSAMVDFAVFDGESGHPVPEATVEIHYDDWPQFFHRGTGPSAQTDESGVLPLEIKRPRADWRLTHAMVSAEGHFPRIIKVPAVKLVDAAYPSPEDTRQRVVPKFHIPLFREPFPVVELVFPTGFRGVFKTRDVQRSELFLGEPGQRTFEYTVPQNWIVEVQVTELLRERYDLRARYADGGAIRDSIGIMNPELDHVIAIRRIHCHGLGGELDWLIVIGTKRDAERIEDMLYVSRDDGVREFDHKALKAVELGPFTDW